MVVNQAIAKNSADVSARYADNFPRHLLGVTRYLQSEIMQELTHTLGYEGLRLSFDAYLALIGERGARPSAIAEILGVSRQACNQTLNQIEQAGYIQRIDDPADGRAKLLQLTRRGKKLRRNGAELAAGIQQRFAGSVGSAAFDEVTAILEQLCAALPPIAAKVAYAASIARVPSAAAVDIRFGVYLSRLSEYVMERLMALTLARGHPDLKLSFGQVLVLIGPSGGRMQQIAAIQSVSKQAISAVAGELEALGYIRRVQDPADVRQLILQFTERGRTLLIDSVAGVDALEQELAACIGRNKLQRLQTTLRALYHSLQVETRAEVQGAVDLRALAQQLRRQLGQQGAQALARLLLDGTGD